MAQFGEFFLVGALLAPIVIPSEARDLAMYERLTLIERSLQDREVPRIRSG
jgi:hypothetical protein